MCGNLNTLRINCNIQIKEKNYSKKRISTFSGSLQYGRYKSVPDLGIIRQLFQRIKLFVASCIRSSNNLYFSCIIQKRTRQLRHKKGYNHELCSCYINTVLYWKSCGIDVTLNSWSSLVNPWWFSIICLIQGLLLDGQEGSGKIF